MSLLRPLAILILLTISGKDGRSQHKSTGPKQIAHFAEMTPSNE